MDPRKERRVRTATRQGEPHVADRDANARANLQEREPDRLTLGVRQRGPHEGEVPERVHQQIGDRGKVQAQLIGAHRGRAGAIREEHELLFLDPVLRLSARTVELFVQGAGVDRGDRERGHHKPRIALAVRAPGELLGFRHHAPRPAPAVPRLIAELGHNALDFLARAGTRVKP